MKKWLFAWAVLSLGTTSSFFANGDVQTCGVCKDAGGKCALIIREPSAISKWVCLFEHPQDSDNASNERGFWIWLFESPPPHCPPCDVANDPNCRPECGAYKHKQE